MAQRKEAKKIKVRDLKPKKDAKGGGHMVFGQRQQNPGHSPTNPGHGLTRPGTSNT
jgi:hypothetical protein